MWENTYLSIKIPKASRAHLRGPGPWLLMARSTGSLYSHDSASLCQQLLASEAGLPLTKSWICTCNDPPNLNDPRNLNDPLICKFCCVGEMFVGLVYQNNSITLWSKASKVISLCRGNCLWCKAIRFHYINQITKSAIVWLWLNFFSWRLCLFFVTQNALAEQ